MAGARAADDVVKSCWTHVVGAHHFLADLALPYGRVLHDYNKQSDDIAEAAE